MHLFHEATTAFIDQHLGDEPSLHPFKPGALELGLAAAIRYLQQGAKIAHRPGLAGWRNAQRQLNRYRFELGEETLEVSLKVAGNLENQLSFTVSTASCESLAIDRITLDGERCHYQLNGVLNRLHYFIRAHLLRGTLRSIIMAGLRVAGLLSKNPSTALRAPRILRVSCCPSGNCVRPIPA